jgi:CDP-glucose 4,6-dehydratase
MESLEFMSFWSQKKVFITGITGLVGSSLTAKLISEGAIVTGLIIEKDINSELIRSGNIDRVTTVNGDLADSRIISRVLHEGNFDVIFHLGAQTIVGTALADPVNTFETNIKGTWNILEASRLFGKSLKSVVVASSDKAYGTSIKLPYTEDFPLIGEGPYDVSKSCTDLLAQSYGKTYNLPVSIARCGNIYGPGDLNWSRIVPGTIKSLLNNEQPVLRSNGDYIRDYIYISDVVNSYLRLAEKQKTFENGSAFNFSTDVPVSVQEIYTEICMAFAGKYIDPRIENSATNEIKAQNLSSEKARQILGWKSEFTLSQGINLTLQWYKTLLKKD